MILMTGFEPFLGEKINPSQKLIEHFRNKSGVQTHLLPVEYDRSFQEIQKGITASTGFVLMLGQASGAQNVRLERVALNLQDATVADGSGIFRRGQSIDPQGPTAFISALPLPDWCLKSQAALASKGLSHRIEISNHAGTYVCNSLYFQVLNKIKIPSLFVHVPLLKEQAVSKAPGTPAMEMDEMVEVLEVLTQELLEFARS